MQCPRRPRRGSIGTKGQSPESFSTTTGMRLTTAVTKCSVANWSPASRCRRARTTCCGNCRRAASAACNPQRRWSVQCWSVSTRRATWTSSPATAWDEWVALDPSNAGRDALPSYWPIRTFRSDVLPASFPARLGLFSYDAGSPLTAGTWDAARQGAACAVAGARALLQGERSAFVLTRPPGHHVHRPRFLRRLLLPQQRRAGGAGAARWRPRARGHPRCRLPPRQRHAGHLLRTRGRVLSHQSRGDPAHRVPVLPGLRRQARRGGGRRMQPQSAAAAGWPNAGATRCASPCGR